MPPCLHQIRPLLPRRNQFVVQADIKWQTQKVLIELGDYTCMQRGEAIERNARFGHGAVDI